MIFAYFIRTSYNYNKIHNQKKRNCHNRQQFIPYPYVHTSFFPLSLPFSFCIYDNFAPVYMDIFTTKSPGAVISVNGIYMYAYNFCTGQNIQRGFTCEPHGRTLSTYQSTDRNELILSCNANCRLILCPMCGERATSKWFTSQRKHNLCDICASKTVPPLPHSLPSDKINHISPALICVHGLPLRYEESIQRNGIPVIFASCYRDCFYWLCFVCRREFLPRSEDTEKDKAYKIAGYNNLWLCKLCQLTETDTVVKLFGEPTNDDKSDISTGEKRRKLSEQ